MLQQKIQTNLLRSRWRHVSSRHCSKYNQKQKNRIL